MQPRHFFKYFKPNVAKTILQTGRMRWSSPALFNDPFDCYFSWEPKFDLTACKERHCERFLDLVFNKEEPQFVAGNRFVAQLQQFREIARRKSRSEVKSIFLDAYPEMVRNTQDLARTARSKWEMEISELRLFCVCEINDNLLLWSHYTDCHQGVVFQLECIKELDTALLVAEPVKYSDTAPGLATEEEWIEGTLGLRDIDSASATV